MTRTVRHSSLFTVQHLGTAIGCGRMGSCVSISYEAYLAVQAHLVADGCFILASIVRNISIVFTHGLHGGKVSLVWLLVTRQPVYFFALVLACPNLLRDG